jgi:hypothetical protein
MVSPRRQGENYRDTIWCDSDRTKARTPLLFEDDKLAYGSSREKVTVVAEPPLGGAFLPPLNCFGSRLAYAAHAR